MWLGGFDGKCRISDIENAYNTVATQIRIIVVERQTPEPRRQVGMTDVRRLGRVGNIINTQTVDVICQVSVSTQHGHIVGDSAWGKAAVVSVTDVNRIDLGGNGDHPTKRADEGEERPQNSSHSFHGASRLDVAKTSCIKGRCLALLVQNTGAAQSMLRAMNGRMWRMTREVKEIPGLISARCLCAAPT